MMRNWLRYIAHRYGIEQSEIAEELGVTVSTISRMMNNKVCVSVDDCAAVADKWNVSPIDRLRLLTPDFQGVVISTTATDSRADVHIVADGVTPSIRFGP